MDIANAKYRYNGNNADVAVISDKYEIDFFVVYQYSKKNDFWRYKTDVNGYRYWATSPGNARQVAYRLFKSLNPSE